MKTHQPTFKKSQINQTLAVLNKIGKSLIDIQEPKKVLRQIAKDAKSILGADIVDLYEYHQAEKEFVLPPILVGERWDPTVTKDRIYDDDVVMQVMNSGQPQYFTDAQHTTVLIKAFEVSRKNVPDKRFVIREGIVSSVSLPLKTSEETVGVMFVNYRTRQAFDDEQKNLIESFANLAAIAIHNARLWKAQRDYAQLQEKLFTERSRQLDTIKEIVRTIGTVSDSLPIILKQVVGLFSANYGAIGLYTSTPKEIQLYAIWEEGTLLTGNDIPADKRIISGEKSIMLHAATIEMAYRVPDVSKDPLYKKWYEKTKSELAVPLKDTQGNVIGVLNLESISLAAFKQADEDLCQGLANVISSVIEKSNLLSAAQNLTRQIELLHSVVGEQDFQKVLLRVLESLNEIMGEGASSSINLYDETRDSVYNILAVGDLAEMLRVPPRPDGTCRYVVSTKEPLYVDNTQYELDHPPRRPTLRKETVIGAGIRSFAALPLIRNERVLGVLFVHQKRLTKFTPEIKLVLDTFAKQAAIAIDNARRALDITALQEINEAIISKPRDEVLNLIAEKAAQVTGADYCSLWMGDDNSGDLVWGALYCPSGELEPNAQKRLPADMPSINMEVYHSGEPVLLEKIEQAGGRYHRIYKPARSELAVPMKYKGKPIGTLNVESKQEGTFSEQNRLMLDTLADQAAIAIKTARLLNELTEAKEVLIVDLDRQNAELDRKNTRLERRNRILLALTEVSQQLTSGIQRSEQEILAIISEQARRIMDTNNMFIALYNPEEDEVRFELAFVEGRKVDTAIESGWGPRRGGKGRTEWIIRHKQPILNYTEADAKDWYQRPDAQEYIGETFASWIGVPMLYGDEALGVIATYHKTEPYKYDRDDLEVLSIMARQAAIALKNARLVQTLARRVEELDVLRALAEELNALARPG